MTTRLGDAFLLPTAWSPRPAWAGAGWPTPGAATPRCQPGGPRPGLPGDAPAILRPLGPVPRAGPAPSPPASTCLSLQSPVSLLLCLSALSGPETEVCSSAISYIKAFRASSKKQMSRLFPPPPLRHTQQEPPGGADRFSPLPAVQCLGVTRTWWPEALHAGPRGLGGPSAPAQPEPSPLGLLWDRVTPRWR